MSHKIYPIGIQNFEEIRKGGYFYADKTALVHKLVKSGKYYFLSRPRRFGKSLLLSTFEAYFQGKKDLFAGLVMEHLEQEWIQYPVLHLDLNAKKYEDSASLSAILNQHLEKWEMEYGNEKKNRSPEERFAYIIEKVCMSTGRNVVVLVDEYDKPLLQTIGDEALQTAYRDTLKAFYGVLKSSDRYLRFVFLTGVTKFSKVSVFSDLNNLEDISIDHRYGSICGITKDELYGNLSEEIRELARENIMTEAEAHTRLKEWYDGYHFNAESEDIYNPFSLLNTFAKMRFGSYWFETGTPTFLVELLKGCHYDLQRLTGEMATADSLSGIDSVQENPVPVLYQSGYLTIKGYDAEFKTYLLGFPNREVEEGFVRFLLPYYASVRKVDSSAQLIRLVQEIRSGQVDSFMQRLQSFFTDTPYELVRDREVHYQNVLFVVCKLLGFYTQAEYHTSRGRIDLLVQTDRFIYVMEFKLNGTAEEALQQINDRQYALPFVSDSRTVYKIGVNFSMETRGLEKWVVERSYTSSHTAISTP